MGEYEIIDNLCSISNELLRIVMKQAEILSQADTLEDLSNSLNEDRDKVSDKLDVIELNLRRYI